MVMNSTNLKVNYYSNEGSRFKDALRNQGQVSMKGQKVMNGF